MDAAKVLEGDLRLLTSESKGFAAVKDSAERGIMKLKEVQDQLSSGEGGRIRCPEFLRPFLLAANHTEAGKRLVSVAIAAMQRLIMMDVVERTEPPNILRVLLIQVTFDCCSFATDVCVWASISLGSPSHRPLRSKNMLACYVKYLFRGCGARRRTARTTRFESRSCKHFRSLSSLLRTSPRRCSSVNASKYVSRCYMTSPQ